MRQQDLETDVQSELRKIIRSIDKKLQHQVQDGPTPQDSLLTLLISQGTLQATMELSAEELREAGADARSRSMLREKIKRARIRLWHPKKPRPFASTKAIRPGAESMAQMRPSGGRR